MKINELKEILKSAYSQEKWVNTLKFLSGTKNLLTILLEPKHEEIKSAKAKEIVREIVRLGTLKTTDGVSLPIYDVTLQDGIKIEYNRVGVNDLLKTHILKDAIKGAIVTFHYREEYNKPEWRFSFISKFGSDYFAEAESIETNPKKYTYIFGTPEEHRTALERLYNLEQSRFRLEDFFEAFNVEPVSNNFFKEYKNFYQDFVFEISNNKQSRAVFEKNGISKDELEKDIRNFVKRLLGRLVFLYFLQKKRWLGASNKNYDDGDTDFLFHLFNYNEESRVYFYNKWLSPLFFNALNTPNRFNDGFELADGNSVWIPFLNGGLFDENQEPEKHREIQFPPTFFELLFKFFNGYNFTIYENSPEDHTVAVDPEMLGHIFENLLEDNKDKGAFYTPKEIVHYMTQESLIEYLNTHLPHSREAIENLIKNHLTSDFTRDNLKQIEKLIDIVKICDPAIGSGAFPMGLLQEIFALKALIHYEMGYAVWSPAKIKQDIIQNSIYGVDLEGGAVDIARLRFWLSLVVDEDLPKPLPNLDYKIMQGNSLLESYAGIDLSNLATADEQIIEEQATLNFGDEFATKVTLFDAVSMEKFQELLDKYFSPEEWEKKTKEKVDKLAVKKQINSIIEGKIHAQLFKEKEATEDNIKAFEYKFNIKKETDLEKLNTKSKEFKNYQLLKTRFNEIETIEAELIDFQNTDERPYFLWNLYFADVFKNGGFDIVIGNPPYVDIKGLDNSLVKLLVGLYPTAFNRINLYSIFIEKSTSLLNKRGVLSFIVPNSLLINDSYSKIRKHILEDLQQIIKLPDAIFQNAIVETIILILNRGIETKSIDSIYFKNDSKTDLKNLVFDKQDKELWKTDSLTKFNIFKNTEESKILELIEENKTELIQEVDFSLGITPYDKAKGHSQEQIKNRVFHSSSKISNEYVPLISGKNIKRYNITLKFDEYLKYGSWLGASRNSKFFTEPKIIIRQILDGSDLSIIAGYTEEEVYFTQIGFSIISKESSTQSLKYILGLLNSQTISFYHKYKFIDIEKNTFPKILIANCKKFPIPIINQSLQKIIESLVNIVFFILNKDDKIFEIIKNDQIANFFEEVIDGCVFELYFKDHMKENGINIIDDVKNHLEQSGINDSFESLNEELKKQKIWELYKAMSTGVVQVKMTDFATKSPDILKPILQS
ncbi:restriction endonuclease subunit M [Flavobacterium cheongpyeongense]|uniref:site-specific DNA-methyltransferase (adenine-specific) n=1 Tax=Flavobacterium cheongpyeongense TaxID=2212651 RepID=A0A2V4BMD4_9FLAO|nr:TaqI-like C-terminal specificity domain-containing protein [Flavobacterium cheongpyeongense]PXY39153.1 restriction endonuclease subunit M [Flavobacterium cheongpyeongense]